MEPEKLITIGIRKETWTGFNQKKLPGETWDSILNRLCVPTKKGAKK